MHQAIQGINKSRKCISSGLSVCLFVLGISFAPATRATEATNPVPASEIVSFPSGNLTLHGFIYKPTGQGPFPAVLYNHGSDKLPGTCEPLARFWTSQGFVFFLPHRSGHGKSPGEWIVDLQQKFRETEKDRALAGKHDVALHERANLDVVAALAWLKQQSFVDTNKVIMSGISYGGIQTILASEKDLGVRAYVPFAPAPMSWKGNPLLRERLLQAVKKAKSPMFLLQAANDYNLGPSELLGGELQRKGPPNRAKIYPTFGDPTKPADGHGGFAVRGSEVWAADVLAFLNEVMKQPDPTTIIKTKTKKP